MSAAVVPPLEAARATAQAAPADAPASEPQTRAGIAPDGLPPKLGDAARVVWQDLRGALSQRLRLLTLELRLAGMTLAQALLCAVAAALLLVTAWLALIAGLVWGAIEADVPWALALGGAVVLNLVAAGVLGVVMLKLAARLDLGATVRALQPHRTPAEGLAPALAQTTGTTA